MGTLASSPKPRCGKATPPQKLAEENVPALSAPGDAGGPCCSLACRGVALTFASIITWLPSLCVFLLSLSLFFSYKDISHIGLSAHPTPV